MKIIIFHSQMIKFGGVETLVYDWCSRLSKYYDITFLYNSCDEGQLLRLLPHVKCEKYNSQKKYECDICLCASSWGGYPDAVTSTKNEYWQMIHANYKEMKEKHNYNYIPWHKTTKHISVSNTVRDVFKEVCGYDSITLYNILGDINETKSLNDDNYELKLFSATRLSIEKGYDRMVKLAKILKSKGIKFKWYIFTDIDTYQVQKLNMPEFVYMKPTYDIWDYLKWADYTVQLSDTEGYSYTINESLQYGVPVICTDFDSCHESVVDGYSGYILDMKLSNLDIDKIINKKLKNFKYTPKCTEQDWIKLIGEPDKDYKKVINDKIRLKSQKCYYDTYFKKKVDQGQIIDVTFDRAKVLLDHKYAVIL